MTAFISELEDLTIHDSGFLELDSGVEISKLPVFDHDAQLFARLGWAPAIAWLSACGMRLPTTAEYDELHQKGLHISPVTLPDGEQLKAAGISPKNKAKVNSHRANNMMSLEWCQHHDDEVWARLTEANWDNQAVANAGKHWALPAGTIYGWWKKAAPLKSKIQNARDPKAKNFPPHGEAYTDYATNFHAVRDVFGKSDTEPSASEESPTDPSPDSGQRELQLTDPWTKGDDVKVVQKAVGVKEDGVFGPDTEHSLVRFQLNSGLPGTGVVDDATWDFIERPVTKKEDVYQPEVVTVALPTIKFRQAKHYYPGRRKGPPIWVVIHTAETIEHSEAAESLQAYAATMADDRVASWHFSVDNNTICQSVRCGILSTDDDTAFAAPGANARGIQIELAGRAQQSSEGWSDDFSRSQLELCSKLVARLCDRWEIPVRKIGASEMKVGKAGICGHRDVTLGVGKGRTTHMDPGTGYPWKAFIGRVQEILDGTG